MGLNIGQCYIAGKKEFITIRLDGLGCMSQTEETETVIYGFV